MAVQPAGLAIVTTTVASEADAARLAALLVEGGLAACVQATRVESTYRWEGDVRREPEWRLDAKTTRGAAGALMTALAEAHPYDEPELIVTAVESVSDGYAAWVRTEVSGSGG